MGKGENEIEPDQSSQVLLVSDVVLEFVRTCSLYEPVLDFLNG